MNKKSIKPLTSALVLSFSLTACLDTNTESETEETKNTQTQTDLFSENTIDASSYADPVYFNLVTGQTVEENADWHIALQRYSVVAHDDSELALLASQSEFYSDESPIESAFVNATATTEEDHLTATYDLENTEFLEPSTSYVFDAGGESFYDYNATNHKLYANDDAVWVVRSNTGTAYAKLRPTQLFDDAADSGNGAYEQATFELFIQGASDEAFANTAINWTIELTQSAGHECFDLDAATEVDCTNDDWDLQFAFNPAAYQFVMSLNGGVSGTGQAAALSRGHFSVSDSANVTAGIQDVADEDFDLTAYHYGQDSQSSVFSETPWYTYNLQGSHGIWPNFRVYAVKKADQTYLVQLTNYYNEQAQSGHITLRYLAAQ